MNMENYKILNNELISKVQDLKLQIRNLEQIVTSERKLYSEENELLKQNFKNLQQNVVNFLGTNYNEFIKVVYPDQQLLNINNESKDKDSRRSSSSFSSNGCRSRSNRMSMKPRLSNYSPKIVANTFSPRKLHSIENFQIVNNLKMRVETLENSTDIETFENSTDNHNNVASKSKNFVQQEILNNDDMNKDLNNIGIDNEINNGSYNSNMLSKITEENEVSDLARNNISNETVREYNDEHNSSSFSNGYQLQSSQNQDTLSDTTIKNLLDAPCSTPFKSTTAPTILKRLQVRIKRFKPDIIDSLQVNEEVTNVKENYATLSLTNENTDVTESKVGNCVPLSTNEEVEMIMGLRDTKSDLTKNCLQKQRKGKRCRSNQGKSFEEQTVRESQRPRRKATPTNLQEPLLKTKMRRE